MCTFVYTSVTLFGPPRKRLLDIASPWLSMAVTFAERDLQKQLPGGYVGRANRAGEGRVGKRQLDLLVASYFTLERVG